jgi:hypothetical protein
MPEMKLMAEIILLVIAIVLIAWYTITNFNNISTALTTWIANLKDMLGLPG